MLSPTLIAITDAAQRGASDTLRAMTELCRLARPGSVAVQLRDREWPIRARLDLGTALREVTRQWGQQLWVNDRLDLALLLSADVLHLPESGVSTLDVRTHLSARNTHLPISEAVHDVDSPSAAEFAILSPIFESRKGAEALGPQALTNYRRLHPNQTLYALGGASPLTAPQAIAAGADGIAAIGAAHEAPMALLSALGLIG